MKKLLKPLKPILYAYLRSDTGKRTVLSLLRSLAKQTNNTVDDQAVDFLEARLFPSETTKLQ
tara:strand:- start:565 stop:750 length:186 start_codon:yes stop_codon:yes gene_type:complete